MRRSVVKPHSHVNVGVAGVRAHVRAAVIAVTGPDRYPVVRVPGGSPVMVHARPHRRRAVMPPDMGVASRPVVPHHMAGARRGVVVPMDVAHPPVQVAVRTMVNVHVPVVATERKASQHDRSYGDNGLVTHLGLLCRNGRAARN